jgi:eukaryotic-like serine/threonine-protein kinase
MTSPNRQLQPDTLVNQATSTGVLAAADFSPGTVVADRFRIERLLGMGGMGLVYLARDTELNIEVALKLLRPELASRRDAFERFRQELLLARQVSSPYVVRIHDLVKHGSSWLISMDYVAGQSLERMLDQRGPLPPEQAIVMVRQLALGLAAAHNSGVVHRDLKPANVLVNEQGEACITDFGVARSAGNTGITDSGVIIGTPAYLSPEQARAEKLDGRSDLYALGLILFEMLTGTLPFRGGTPAEMLVQRIVREPPSAATIKPELPSFVVRLCAHLLELKPAHRFQTAEELIKAIDTRRVPGHSRPRRIGGRLLLGTLVLLAAAFGLARWGNFAAVPQPTAATPAAALDVAALPLVVDSNEPGDRDLGRGIGGWLADQLADNDGPLHGADELRVARALAELGYDAEAAQRQLQRVSEVMGVRQLISGKLQRDPSGLIIVQLALWDIGAAQPQWTAASEAVSEADLPLALRALHAELLRQLGTAAPVAAWPPTPVLASIGHLQLGAPAVAEVGAVVDLAQQTSSAPLWWTLLAALDRAGRNAEAATAARRVLDTLTPDASPGNARVRAYAQLLLGDVAAARTSLSQLSNAAPDDHRVRLLLARAHAEAGEFPLAVKQLETVVAQDQRNIDAWYALGKYAIQSGDAKRAVDEYLVRAQVLANRLDDRRMQADVGNALGIGYRRLGQLGPAAERFESAIRLRHELDDARGEAASLRNLATVRSIQGEFDAAKAALAQAQAIIEPLGDSVALAALANDVGVLAEERGDYPSALASYRDALRLRQTQGEQRLIGESQINVGFAYYQLGEFDNAQTYWQQATSTFAAIDDRVGIVHARQSLGLAEIARGDWRQARASLEDSLAASESMQMAEERSISQAGLAELDRLEGRMDSALTLSAQALDGFEQREDLRGIVEMKLLQSAVYCDLGDWTSAAAVLAELDPGSVAKGEQAGLFGWRQGEIALGSGDAKAALASADAAIVQAESGNSHSSELSARLLRARALAALSRARDAQDELRRVEQDLARYASVPLRLLQAETELALAPAPIGGRYREVLNLLARLPAYARAFLLHGHAAARMREQGAAAAADARVAADQSYAELQSHTPPAQRPALALLARSAGLSEVAP